VGRRRNAYERMESNRLDGMNDVNGTRRWRKADPKMSELSERDFFGGLSGKAYVSG
jgi:hypothetical protein